jgi:hypothetical protein
VVPGLNDDIINVGFNIAVQLACETELDHSLVRGTCVLQPEGHGCIGIRTIGCDERGLDLVFFLEGNLMVARVAIKEAKQYAAGCGVDDLVDAWEPEGLLRSV